MATATLENVQYHLGNSPVATIRAAGGMAWTVKMMHDPQDVMKQAYRVAGYGGERDFGTLRGVMQHIRHCAEGKTLHLMD